MTTLTARRQTGANWPKPSPNRLRRRTALIGWSFILPNFLGFALFTLIPVIAAMALSFMQWDSYSAPKFVGLKNFRAMIADENFWVALRNTALYALGHIPLTLVVSLALAMLLNQKLKGIGFFRVAMFFPYITSLVAVAIVWNMLFNPAGGPIDQFLRFIGVANPPGWTNSTEWALPAVIITSVWRDMGYYMVLYLAGLQAIPTELYEAAEVDGANAWQRFWNVTIPSLRPTTFFVMVMLTVASFKIFDLIIVMTNGGPGRATMVLSQLIYQNGILQGEFGYSSAISFVLFLIVLSVTVIQFKIQQRQER
ncbi:carbohydrate ABC transporter permease [Enemella evansiae]|uniref:ABC transporter permease n=1 Tax=Enemella evansiae TaxID=2016499 RepID=A0A255G487_9ACTN|nr:sugar ABC transporter permease [Enemella evansiae]PFG67343.1 multiple sugar transport system permease protein/alpha-1,4-digalacturonate transport system permease protein [Propionibacteriaceae bacterium ES.041]OYN99124.1 ABC transporter permease [Enemella evansiae]OYO05214.1 ABC transporter permease [Enemella evansiae]OYO10739.1 ABC transporter permease [Enemella evansiae]OYO15644.1 ABC transporter permease [Enemella evansiae]